MFANKSSTTGYEKVPGSENDVEMDGGARHAQSPSTYKKCLIPFVALLLTSNICTWFISGWSIRTVPAGVPSGRSAYAGLAWDHPVHMHAETPYNQQNETLRDAAWEAINIDAGMIALPEDFIAQKALPDSQQFVWDHSKHLYLLNGHHTLHCVRAVYISLMEFRQNKKQSRRWEHVVHCVDQLRQEAICNADDTPRYSTPDDIPGTGMGQARMCRSWDKLEKWARSHSACYRYINQTASYKNFPEIERFVWCPEGSPYTKEVEKVFGHIEWDENGYTISEPKE